MSDELKKDTFVRVVIKAKGSKKVFAEGFEPGVLTYQDVKFDKGTRHSQVAMSLNTIHDRLMEECFEVEMPEISKEEFDKSC